MVEVVVRAKLQSPRGNTFGDVFERRLQQFEKSLQQVADQAAQKATSETRSRVRYMRETTPTRRGRFSTQGQLATQIRWNADPVTGGVELDVARLNRATPTTSRTPYWLIQEIGTGQSATIRKGGVKNRRGRPSKGAQNHVKIPSQIGRRIPGSLAFGSGGRFTPFGAARGEALQLRANLRGAPIFAREHQGARITREIKGKHFVRDGAKEGFREYKKSLLAAAKSSLTSGQKFR